MFITSMVQDFDHQSIVIKYVKLQRRDVGKQLDFGIFVGLKMWSAEKKKGHCYGATSTCNHWFTDSLLYTSQVIPLKSLVEVPLKSLVCRNMSKLPILRMNHVTSYPNVALSDIQTVPPKLQSLSTGQSLQRKGMKQDGEFGKLSGWWLY